MGLGLELKQYLTDTRYIYTAAAAWVVLVMAHPFLAITAYHHKDWRRGAVATLLFFVTTLVMVITVLLPIALTGWAIKTYAVPYLEEYKDSNKLAGDLQPVLDPVLDDLRLKLVEELKKQLQQQQQQQSLNPGRK